MKVTSHPASAFVPATPLARRLRALRVPRGSLAICWLGQAGFVLKSPGGRQVALDPYLSNSCAALGRADGLDMRRRWPAPLRPGDLAGCDALLFTHSHQDHLDPQTLTPYLRAGGFGPFVAPHEAAERLRQLGAPASTVVTTWPNHTHQVGDLSIRATFAIPLAGDDLTHVGYLVGVKDGPTVYFTGDTDYNDILGIAVKPHRPDVMVAVVNSAFRNLSPREAAQLAKTIGPRWVVPCHHDLFRDNSLPDRLLRTNLLIQGIVDTFCPLPHGGVGFFHKPARGAVTYVASAASRRSRR